MGTYLPMSNIFATAQHYAQRLILANIIIHSSLPFEFLLGSTYKDDQWRTLPFFNRKNLRPSVGYSTVTIHSLDDRFVRDSKFSGSCHNGLRERHQDEKSTKSCFFFSTTKQWRANGTATHPGKARRHAENWSPTCHVVVPTAAICAATATDRRFREQ